MEEKINLKGKLKYPKTYNFRDPVVQRVCDKFVERSDTGFKKYGKTLHEERVGGHKDLAGYLNDVQEELMDSLLYIEAARRCLTDEVEEVMLRRMNIIGQNGNDGEHYGAEEI